MNPLNRHRTVVNNSCAALLACSLLLPHAASGADAYSAKTYPPDAVKKLIVETDSGAILIGQVIDAPVTVDVSPAAGPGDDCRITQDLRGGTLHLSAHAARNVLGMSKSCSAGFTVYSHADEIQARSGSGDVSLGGLGHKADIRTGSGSIQINGVPADLVLRTGSGRIRGSGGSTIDAATGSGDINLFGLHGLVKARSGSGAIQLDWTSAPSSGNIEVGTGNGNFSASFPKGTKLKTSVRSAAGNIRSDFDDKDAKLTLTFKSGSGDASVTRKP